MTMRLSANNWRRVVSILAMALVAILSGCIAYVEPTAGEERQVDLTFVTHVAAGLAEQDVFVVSEADGNQVMRILPDQVETLVDAPVFAAAEFVEHDPFGVGEQPIGPFVKGEELDMTLGEWLAATGAGTYTVRGGKAEVDLSFNNLVPNGTYTLWCSYGSPPPNFYAVDLPCGALDGSQNSFAADEDGHAELLLVMDKLVDATPDTMVVVAVAYHSQGETNGISPGAFGADSHVQLFAAIPPPDAEAWRTIESNSLASSTTEITDATNLSHVRIYADADGESHFAEATVDFELADMAPPAPPLHLSAFTPASEFAYVVLPAGWDGIQHPAPLRAAWFVLSGEMEIITSDGESRRFVPGSIFVAEDTTGQGHTTRAVGADEVLLVVVALAE